jgi:hypothetical protein
MSLQKSNYQVLVEKLDQFIRKFYVNKLIKGSLYSTAIVLAMLLVFSMLEYFFYFGTGVRKLFFYSFIGVSIASIGYYVIDPLVRYFHLGKNISHDDAALIIGNHFSDVKDKLLNILQLKRRESGEINASLITASIEQKTNEIKLVPFKSAINLQQNRKYLKYALPPFLLLIFVLFAAPSIITDSTSRIIQNNKKFAKAAPFSYIVNADDLKVLQFQDFTLNFTTKGSVDPKDAFVVIDGFQYKATKQKDGSFAYTFKNVQKDTEFYLQSGTVESEGYILDVLEKPNLTDFTVALDYPGYVGRLDEVLANTGDLILPEGTKITWLFDAIATDNIGLQFGSKPRIEAERRSDAEFRFKKSAVSDELYKMFLSNKYIKDSDSLLYSISVVKDQFPTISSEKLVDSLDKTLVYFIGNASDDYGINSLSFNYNITRENGQQLPLQSTKMTKADGREIQYDYVFDIKKIDLKPGDKISFYFEVADNDGVNGSKKSKSTIMTYEKPTLAEVKLQDEMNDEAIKDKLKDALKDIDKLQDNMKKLKEKLLQSKNLNWQDKKEMEKLLDEQKKLQEQIEKAKEKLDENIANQEEFQTQPEEILEKQQKLQELFEKALDPEQKELMDKIKELLQELEKEDAVQMMEEFEMSNETLEKEMDRMLELYKQLEMEKNIKDQIKDLEKLAEEQEKLAEKAEKEKESPEELKKQQDDLNKKLEDLMKKQEELEKKNDELTPPKDMGEKNEEKMDDAKKDMEKASEDLKKKDSKSASKKQKKAAKKMKDQAAEMESSMEGGESEQAGEDVKTLRQLLENLVKLSYEQEDLIKGLDPRMVNTPAYPGMIRQQFKLQKDFKHIEDTLTALSQRNSDIESFIMDKVADIKFNMKASITQLEERQVPLGQERQRVTMKNVNDLAVMLNESLEKAQKKQSGGMPGSQMCDKPGGKKGSKPGESQPMNKITEGQQGLSDDLKKMKEKLDKEGKEGKEGGSAKDFAQAAARQAAMRKALQEMQNKKKEEGKGSKEIDDIIQGMDKIETELVNKRLNGETLKRMKDIETRLLEAERAERQREQDNKRKSETAQEVRRQLPPSLQEYLKKRQAEIDMYKSTSPSLRPYYKALVEDYYKSLKTGSTTN